ncbi:MAG: hypothetical protein COZ34_03715 [Candidatus Pacebacteria bacterium CG_4_10_14_3_um_filter_34_15]|nr:GNAT family N-acetyltransferase [Candidatus Pacearchaeota archaeon]NCQ65911.1 GNAT family N-acetyltransferase [Candidatus Paceibacterota bacterium]OIO44749.1 MAG: hypothetical protein AUJ41_02105 [Candidatus Pacebacteria bacterium CG1_02_43_31]PIQ81139.1 MAG: hypothetical protein COV78_01860 [Candidatus Pacebacteria bacterium CG11_big_fil_rev_8_21_14_0_20_34_55]PIX81366.1 MAG: hypothetical protein COZ34_03715 [Candidatus Pacebacteria bacterium CG_4_10_14_3_um_filter_34_15]PJC43714.1 MAG: hy
MKGKIKITVLTEASYKDIINIQKIDGWRHVYYLNENRLRELSKRGEVFYGMYLDGIMIGFAGVDVEIRARLHFLSIDNKYQKKGYGTLFVKELVKIMKTKNIKQMFFYVEEDSPYTIFLSKLGFIKVGFYKNRFGDGWDADIFELKI